MFGTCPRSSASFSRSSAMRNRASRTVWAARSANSRYHDASSRSLSASGEQAPLLLLIIPLPRSPSSWSNIPAQPLAATVMVNFERAVPDIVGESARRRWPGKHRRGLAGEARGPGEGVRSAPAGALKGGNWAFWSRPRSQCRQCPEPFDPAAGRTCESVPTGSDCSGGFPPRRGGTLSTRVRGLRIGGARDGAKA